jgi:glycosyltransferase involved in cell wall biosynthesis
MSISAFIPVFNEEKRIKHALASLQWCNEIILLDKYSTDKTVEIAKTFGDKVKVCYMENSDAYSTSEMDYLFDNCTSEWIIIFTASDVIDKVLTEKILEKIADVNFNYDIINIPYKRYVLGIESKNSPWHTQTHPSVFKKTALKVNKGETHSAFSFIGKNYYFKGDKIGALHHLTHETVDGMTLRHIRYWRAEGSNYNQSSLKKPLKAVFRSLYIIFFKRRTFMIGKRGIVLMCAYLSYYLMSLVYKWENKNSNAKKEYDLIREKISASWK